MVDLHTHLLPGVDDGSRTFERSVAVLARMAASGVTTLACTPHLRASQAQEAPRARHESLIADLRAMVPAPQLVLGWEIMLDEPGVDLSGAEFRLGGSTAVLVEFTHSGVPPRASFELARLRESGVVPVLAHPERYWGASVTHVREWRSVGAVMQGDASYLLGKGERARLARALLEQGLVDLLASDNHGDRRDLGVARDWLVEIGAGAHASLLTTVNPSRLLRDEPVKPVPGLELPRGFADQLRDILFGRRA